MENQINNAPQMPPMPPAPPKPKKALHVVTLIFVILIFIVTSLILAENTVYVGVIAGEDSAVEVAETQGNLGNYNVECVKNTLTEKADGSYTLTAQMKFTNYGSEGYSFVEAVDVVAYQDNKEVPMTYDYDLIVFDGEEASTDDESNLRVRNGKDATVVLVYQVENPKENILIEMKSGSYSYTYTVNLEG